MKLNNIKTGLLLAGLLLLFGNVKAQEDTLNARLEQAMKG